MSAQRAKLLVSLVGGVQCFYFGGLINFAYCMITIHTADSLNVSMFVLAHGGSPWGGRRRAFHAEVWWLTVCSI